MADLDSLAEAATYQDLLALPEELRAEVVGGRVVTAPAPLPRHSWSAGAVNRFVGGPFGHDHGRGGPGGWWILAEVDVRLTEHDIVRPDIAGWRRERFPDPWDVRPIDVVPDWVCEVVPDWVCEVISPSNAAHDRVTKAQLYADHGLPFLWLLDPAARVLECFELAERAWLRFGSYADGARARIKPFEAVELDVGGVVSAGGARGALAWGGWRFLAGSVVPRPALHAAR